MAEPIKTETSKLDQAVILLNANKDRWAQTTNQERITILSEIKDNLIKVASNWVITAGMKKEIPEGSPLIGEEWTSGPYALMCGCNLFIDTLSQLDGKRYLNSIPVRELGNGQIAAKVVPHAIWDHVLLSGITAEVWMEKGITKENLRDNTASTYATPPENRKGKVSLILGAGNIASIAPLDCFHKLFVEHQVTILKMNPVNDYLTPFLEAALKPLIDIGALQIVRGGADIGEYLCNHPDITDIHITGAGASHDIIVWGAGEEGLNNKAQGTPRNSRRITSELGAVCPTIIVPGPWTRADLQFQAEQVASQKLHNSGFNCIACQMLILPKDWDKTETFLTKIEKVMKNAPYRGLYYPGASDRISEYESHAGNVVKFERPGTDACVIAQVQSGDATWLENNEVFAPAMSTKRIAGSDPEAYLRAAIDYANVSLHGTLGANILIHPKTIEKIGRKKFDEIITNFHYGCIAVNAWSGLGFSLPQTPWGAFPGHTLDDVQSGIGFVHNSFLFDRPERTVIEAPFKPFPRNLLSGGTTLLPKPPWFITHKTQHKLGMLLTHFQHRPSWFKLPRILLNAMLG